MTIRSTLVKLAIATVAIAATSVLLTASDTAEARTRGIASVSSGIPGGGAHHSGWNRKGPTVRDIVPQPKQEGRGRRR